MFVWMQGELVKTVGDFEWLDEKPEIYSDRSSSIYQHKSAALMAVQAPVITV